MACLDVLVRARSLPAWDHSAGLSGLAVEGGGPVATALVAAQRLGAPAGFVGTCGSDRLGRIKLQTLAEEGVDVSRARIHPGREDQVILVLVRDPGGERVFSSVPDWGRAQLDPDALDRAYITSASILHLDGFHAEAALRAAGWMRALGKPVMLDGSATRGPVTESMRAMVAACDVLICGHGFAPALSGRSGRWEAAEAILRLGPRVIVQTEGAEGSYTLTPTERFHTPAFAAEVVDTTGAGDVFHGAYLAGLLQGWDARANALFSSAVAALKCRALGGRAGIPTFAETLAFLRARGVPFPYPDPEVDPPASRVEALKSTE